MARSWRAEDLAGVLVCMVAWTPTRDQLLDWTDLSWDEVGGVLAHLRRRGLVRHLGGGHYAARQRDCAGCGRSGRELKGEAVEFDPETLTWCCDECWRGEVERVRAIVG